MMFILPTVMAAFHGFIQVGGDISLSIAFFPSLKVYFYEKLNYDCLSASYRIRLSFLVLARNLNELSLFITVSTYIFPYRTCIHIYFPRQSILFYADCSSNCAHFSRAISCFIQILQRRRALKFEVCMQEIIKQNVYVDTEELSQYTRNHNKSTHYENEQWLRC